MKNIYPILRDVYRLQDAPEKPLGDILVVLRDKSDGSFAFDFYARLEAARNALNQSKLYPHDLQEFIAIYNLETGKLHFKEDWTNG